MKPRRVLLLGMLLLFAAGLSSSSSATARDISEQCRADIRAVYENCRLTCPGNLRCFIRCVVNNFPASCLE